MPPAAMLFTSFAFAIFLPLFFCVYWTIGGQRAPAQNALLVIASYVFYGWWDWRLTGLLLASTALNFSAGLLLGRPDNRFRKIVFFGTIAINLAVLAFFKYFNFFSENMVRLLRGIGLKADDMTLHIFLPVGISFYTFHSMSYVIDLYRRRIAVCRDPAAFAAFVSFFPLLVAGPVVRAGTFLPQFQRPRAFADAAARDGLRQMLWGFFKKMVVADGAAIFVNAIFSQYRTQSPASLAAGAVLFAFQMYADFSGYSDIAIGVARLSGFHITPNFSYPYFSRDVAEYWRRWHISLSSWFRDYVFTPLSLRFRFWGKTGLVTAVMVNFFLTGLWHGASWTFIVWGMLHALYFIPLILLRRGVGGHYGVPAEGRWLPSLRDAAGMAGTFLLVCFALIFFRAPDLHTAFGYIRGIVSGRGGGVEAERRIFGFIGMMMVVEWLQRARVHGLEIAHLRPRGLRWAIYIIVAVITFYFGAPAQVFIYFQF